MTRPKVEDEKRQRTSQACDSCKRRKQKCDGLQPCHTCSRRQLTCTYLSLHNGMPGNAKESDRKRRRTTSELGESNVPYAGNGDSPSSFKHELSHSSGGTPRSSSRFLSPQVERAAERTLENTGYPHAPSSGDEEEAENHNMTRMLVDPTGRLLYIGDTASVSFLQLIRLMVESSMGPSQFTTDPLRHQLTENTLVRPKHQMTHLLPDRQTANVLVHAFFVNANLVQVFDEQRFYKTLDECYSSPLFVDPSWLCLLNLVFAIGLVLATPMPGTTDAELIDGLRNAYKCDIFFHNAKHLHDPIIGFEDADFWSVQALLLMAKFMLCRSKRNSAFAYTGMAVRSAYALGLHREETLVIFPEPEQRIRQQVWRSLFVMDRFLAISLGRPPAVREEDCSGDALDPPPLSQNVTPAEVQFYHSGLEAGVRCCHILSVIIREIYQKRKVSTRTAQEIAEQCRLWPKTLPPAFHWRQASPSDPRQGITILHVNMLYCHAIVLFTRPFFLYLLSSELQQKHFGSNLNPQPRQGKMKKFSEACIIASLHTIALVQNACDGGYLPRQNPFVIYCLFSAALVVMSGRLASHSTHEASDQSIENALSILTYCSKMDIQAARMVQILKSFQEVVSKQGHSPHQPMSTTIRLPSATPAPFSPINPYAQHMKNPSHRLLLPSTFYHLNNPLPPTTTTSTTNATETTDSSAPLLTPSLPYIRTDSFSGLLDSTNLDSNNADHPLGNISDESSGPDNEIDFDALWAWPGGEFDTNGVNGLGVGVGEGGGEGENLGLKGLDGRGVVDGPIAPLFGDLGAGEARVEGEV